MVFTWERENEDNGVKRVRFMASSRLEAEKRTEGDLKEYLGPGKLISDEEPTKEETPQ